MAPRETPKATPKVQRTIIKTTKTKASPVATIRKAAISSKKTPEKNLKVNNTTIQPRTRTNTVPNLSTPKPKEHKPAQIPSSASKSAKKASWKRRPKPAHSGVPVPEKMRKLLEKQLQDSDCSL
ncbi:uncharacterized protein LOC126769062 [Nymphalis io]|uniref:uncharacterized protein LOC126769062 n=1 Tax=Inachis io TaxID=171585 RepID=UPI00216947B0|nr:uncharacterized protein LOC126769062 [Nymphalis io]